MCDRIARDTEETVGESRSQWVVRMNGAKQVLAVKIDPEAFQSGDAEMLQDLVQAAFNQALRQVDQALSEKLGGLTGGLLPGGLKIPGLF